MVASSLGQYPESRSLRAIPASKKRKLTLQYLYCTQIVCMPKRTDPGTHGAFGIETGTRTLILKETIKPNFHCHSLCTTSRLGIKNDLQEQNFFTIFGHQNLTEKSKRVQPLYNGVFRNVSRVGDMDIFVFKFLGISQIFTSNIVNLYEKYKAWGN